MGRYTLMAFTAPKEGNEHEYNAWYDNVHIPGIIRDVPGVVAATRYSVSDIQLSGRSRASASIYEMPFPYMAIYEIETDDLAGVLNDIKKSAKGDEPMRKIVVSDETFSICFEQVSRRQTAN